MFYQNWARFCSFLQLFAALCWQPVPCAATEVLGLLCSSGIFLTSFTSAPGCFISHIIIKVCNKLLAVLQTFRQVGEGVCSATSSDCSLEIGENGVRLRKLSHIPTPFVMFLKGSKSHRCFECQVRNALLRRIKSREVMLGTE